MAQNDKIPPPPPPAPTREPTTAEAIAALALQLKPQDPLLSQGFPAEAVAAAREIPKPLRWRVVSCKSELTGATFDALVIESRTHVAGRITQLLRYKHPRGTATYESQGGLVPEGMPILRDGNAVLSPDTVDIPGHALASDYKQWRWTEFWQKDLRHYCAPKGNTCALTPGMCVEPSGFQTPWQDGAVRRVGDAA
jgi:hypothetical protein